MVRFSHLNLEILEDRLTPTTAPGVLWPDPSHLTVSFVNDGTGVGASSLAGTSGPTSQLFQTFNSQMPGGAWQQEVLRALQTWADQINANLQVSADNGQPLAANPVGSASSDNIRIAAVPLSSSSVAIAVPFDPLAGNASGEILFNTNYAFTTTAGDSTHYNLYSIALHEAGHLFGLPDSDDETSVMYDNYAGPRTGLSAEDIADVQARYGARSADPFAGNNSAATATPYLSAVLSEANLGTSGMTGMTGMTGITGMTGGLSPSDPLTPNPAPPGMTGTLPSSGPFSVTADLTRNGEQDWYACSKAAGSGFTVQLQTAGVSLLEGQLTVLDAAGNVVASATASNPQNGNLSLYLAPTLPAGQYFLEVSGANSGAFGVGSYHLNVIPDAPVDLSGIMPFNGPGPQGSGGHATLQTAEQLTPALVQPGDAVWHAAALGSSPGMGMGSTHYYQIQIPAGSGLGQTSSLNVTVSGGSSAMLFDANGNMLMMQLAFSTNGFNSYHIDGLAAGGTYYLGVMPMAASASVVVEAQNSSLTTTSGLTETATTDQRVVMHGIEMTQSQVVQLEVASAGDLTQGGMLEIGLYDPNGNLILDELAMPGTVWQENHLLLAGNYLLVVVDRTTSPSVNLSVQGQTKVLSDPIGPGVVDPANPPSQPNYDFDPIWYDTGFTTLLQLMDPYASPISLPPPGLPKTLGEPPPPPQK